MKTLTNEALCALAQSGDEQAREQLITNNLPFIHQAANRRMANPANTDQFNACGITADDLIQAGGIGLLKAIESYDPSTGNTFMTYAGQAAINAMNELVSQYSRDFAWRLSVDSSKSVKVLSWDNPYSDYADDDDYPVAASETFRVNSCFPSPEDEVIRQEAQKEVRDAVALLPERETVFIRYRFGFDDDESHTLTEAAEIFHLSESRAKGLEKSALNKVKGNLFVVLPEQVRSKAEDGLTKLLVAEGELHAVELRLKSQKKRGRKITAAVYEYLADYDGYLGEFQYDFVRGSAEVITLAEWDTTITRRFAMRAVEYFRKHGSDALPDRLVLTFIVPDDYVE